MGFLKKTLKKGFNLNQKMHKISNAQSEKFQVNKLGDGTLKEKQLLRHNKYD